MWNMCYFCRHCEKGVVLPENEENMKLWCTKYHFVTNLQEDTQCNDFVFESEWQK